MADRIGPRAPGHPPFRYVGPAGRALTGLGAETPTVAGGGSRRPGGGPPGARRCRAWPAGWGRGGRGVAAGRTGTPPDPGELRQYGPVRVPARPATPTGRLATGDDD